jgi:CBS domain containing-hemolysin-like protein
VASTVAAHSTAVAIAFVVITYLHLVLGEFVPKALALESTEKFALLVARPMEIFYRVFKAPIWLINRSGVLILRWLGSKETVEHAAAYSEEELRHLVGLSHKSGHLIEDERLLINNVFDFTESTGRKRYGAADRNRSTRCRTNSYRNAGDFRAD